ncbi:MAG: FAD-dependent monooxygenase [Pseudomonadota bacterium]|nr:FAD-dependent monooxygenase [Pseudomonadota bacterium]
MSVAASSVPRYELPRWPFVRPAELDESIPRRHPVVIAGAGLAGLTLACELAARGVAAVLLDDDDTVGVRGASSRGICYAQKSLEIFARLGLYERIRAKGITWSVGRTFSGADEIYAFDLEATSRSQQPAFINLQQFYVEWFLVERIVELAPTMLRWKHRVEHVADQGDCVVVEVTTPAGAYRLEADWFVDASGANSAIRDALGLDARVSRSTDRWCISDVRFATPFPPERWTWIDAPFNEGRAVWQHLMADDVWRLDYQMPEGADPEATSRPEVVGARLRQQLGPGVDFEFVWIGPYQYRDHLLEKMKVGRVFFAGDSAHVVSPFGARGGNNGIQDAANLAWKLALVVQGAADVALLESYDVERHAAAVENLRVARRTTRFLAPRNRAERRIRQAVIDLARTQPFARRLVDTGRMAVANDYPPSTWAPQGAASLPNVAVDGDTLVGLLGAGRFVGLWLVDGAALAERTVAAGLEARWPIVIRFVDLDADFANPVLARMLDGGAGCFVLVRPDGYVAARIVAAHSESISAAMRRALSRFDPIPPSSTNDKR